MKKGFGKKALSDIVSTLLILLLVFVAIAIVWLVVRNVIKQGTEQISLGKFTLDLQIEQVSIDKSLNGVSVVVKRNVGEGEFVGIKFIISDGEQSESFSVNQTLEEGEKNFFNFNLARINCNNIQEIEIAPIFRLSSGKEVTGDIKDTWENSEGSENVYSSPETTGCLSVENCVSNDGCCPAGCSINDADCAQCTSDLNCTADYNSTDYYCYLNTNNVYKTFNDYSCSGGVCVNNPTAVLVQVCNSTQTCSNGICVNNQTQNPPQNQTCSGSSTQSCTITNGVGSQSRTCTNGVWSSWGTCTVVSCNSGYVISGNSCVANTPILPDDTNYLFSNIDLFSYGRVIATISTESQFVSALASASPGDTIVIANGVYSDFNPSISVSGTSNSPIIIRPQTAGGVKFTGSSKFIFYSDYLIFGGFVFENINSDATLVFSGATHNRATQNVFFQCGTKNYFADKMIDFTSASQYNRLDHNLFKCIIGSNIGIEVRREPAYASDINPDCTVKSGTPSSRTPNIYNYHNVIDHNLFKDIPSTSSIPGGSMYGGGEGDTWNEGESIQLGYGASGLALCPTYTIISYNIFDSACGDPEIISNKASNATIMNNVFMQTQSVSDKYRMGGPTLRGGINSIFSGNYLFDGISFSIHGENHIITNNYFEGASEYTTFSLWPGDDGTVAQIAKNNLIAHNTFVDFTKKVFYIGRDCSSYDNPPSNNKYLNNLFYSNVATEGAIYKRCSENDVVQNNLIKVNGGREGDWSSGYVTSDPQLISSNVNGYTLYRLSSSSPAVNTGINAGVLKDIFGRNRNSPDIGAEEYTSGSIANMPLKTSDIMSSWMNSYANQVCNVW